MDVDIDLKTDFDPNKYFDVINASRIQNEEIKKHNVGVYFQNIPVDNISGFAAIPFKEAEKLGYLKVDLLHLEILNYFENNKQIRVLSNVEPDWTLLDDPNVVKKLFQISRQFDLINTIKPTSINELADCLALMRPGKAKLLQMYLEKPIEIRKILYIKDSDFSFKRSHAIAYATTIVLQLHLVKKGII